MAVILYNTNRMFNSLWSESKLQGSVARDYSIFFWIVAFGAYLLSVTWADITNEAWVCEGACDTAEDEDTDEAYDLEGGEKFNPGIALKLMARAVPRCVEVEISRRLAPSAPDALIDFKTGTAPRVAVRRDFPHADRRHGGRRAARSPRG